MDCRLFIEWFKELDRRFVTEKLNVVLLIDNCLVHSTVEFLKVINLFLLPSNTTTVTPPIDPGINLSLKAHYRTIAIRKFIVAVVAKKLLPKFISL